MDTQTELENEIGTLELERKTLKPTKVKIVNVEIVPVGKNNNLKVNCLVKHPDTEQEIHMSSVAYLRFPEKKVVTIGLWYNLDKEKKIQKDSALAIFLNSVNAKNLKELKRKEVETELDGNFLCFKAY